MLLAVDIGNTNVVFGLYRGRSLEQTFRVSTVITRTEDEYGVLLQQLLMLRKIPSDSVDAAIISSVVPPLTEVMAGAVRHAFARDPLVVGPGLKTGMPVLMENPREVGADRIVNAVAAYELTKSSVIVVDFGTATTFDCVSAKGEYLGGVIVPGVQVSLEGLISRAAKLSRVELAAPPHVIGRNTTHALQSGVVFGYASMVDGMIARLEAELGHPCRVLATGGLAALIAKHTERLAQVDVNLTLDGLCLIHERNAGAADAAEGTTKRRASRAR